MTRCGRGSRGGAPLATLSLVRSGPGRAKSSKPQTRAVDSLSCPATDRSKDKLYPTSALSGSSGNSPKELLFLQVLITPTWDCWLVVVFDLTGAGPQEL